MAARKRQGDQAMVLVPLPRKQTVCLGQGGVSGPLLINEFQLLMVTR